MKLYHQPSGLDHGLDLLLNPDWSPEQAMAVFELLDDLRDRLWAHYEFTLMTRGHHERVTHVDVEITDPPF